MQGVIEVEMIAAMGEQGCGKAKRTIGACVRQNRLEMAQAAALQIVLAGIVGIEGRAADIGSVADVLHRQIVIAACDDQRHQGAMQVRPRPGDTAIGGVRHDASFSRTARRR